MSAERSVMAALFSAVLLFSPYFFGFSYITGYLDFYSLSVREVGLLDAEIYVLSGLAILSLVRRIFGELVLIALVVFACFSFFLAFRDEISHWDRTRIFNWLRQIPSPAYLVFLIFSLLLLYAPLRASGAEKAAQDATEPNFGFQGGLLFVGGSPHDFILPDSPVFRGYDRLLFANREELFILRRFPNGELAMIRVMKSEMPVSIQTLLNNPRWRSR